MVLFQLSQKLAEKPKEKQTELQNNGEEKRTYELVEHNRVKAKHAGLAASPNP